MSVDERALYAYIGRQLRERRRALGHTQQWLAEQLGVERTSVSNIETGIQRVPLHMLYRCCEIFNAEITDLIPTKNAVIHPTSRREKVAVQMDGRSVEMPLKAASLVQSLYNDLKEAK